MKVVSFITVVILIVIFRSLFSFSDSLSSGDWPYLFVENIREFSFFPEIRFLWLAPYYQITTKILVEFLGISWEVTERLLWFFPFLILCSASSYYLTRSWIGVLIYTTNTYVLMLVGGGQMGITMAYSISPFVFKKFLNFTDSSFFSKHIKNQKSKIKTTIQNVKTLQSSILLGLFISVLTMFDPRVSYILAIAIALSMLMNFKKLKNVNFVLNVVVIPGVITIILNSYWIIPILQGNIPQEFKGLQSVAGFEFLSFADFSHAFALLHPNWPENIFGKTSFLKPEFLLLPILAYCSLLSLGAASLSPRGWDSFAPKEKGVLFFALLGLLGTFLAKGDNEPFGWINQFIFQYIPGMSMFRDPTKFYLLIALSYSVLIPFSLHAFEDWIKSKIKNQKFNISYVSLLFIFYSLLLVWPAFSGQLTGTFKTHEVPKQYLQLKDFINSQEEPFQTLWIPQRQRFGFSSKNHPAISGNSLYSDTDSYRIVKKIDLLELKKNNVLYIIIPYDSQKELFIKDRKYSEKLRQMVIEELDEISNLTKIASFSPIILYKIK